MLLRLGKKKFGPTPENVSQIIDNETSPNVLDDWSEKMLLVENWQDLIDKQNP
jgi:hypothetical protein